MSLETVLIISFALLLDKWLGEVRIFHPLAGFGNCALLLEKYLNRSVTGRLKLKGVLALLILIAPLPLIMLYLHTLSIPQLTYPLVDVLILYLATGRKSLHQHALEVMQSLEQNDLVKAREKISLIVSRDTQKMSRQQIVTACLESVIENSNDAVFGAIVWYLLAGASGVVVYRLVNTLDAMWGYKNDRYIYFGWAAARFDDALNWLPARLTVLSFAILGGFKKVWSRAFQQGMKCSSKNAGPVMAAGACALNIKLGGEAQYNGVVISKPDLGCGNRPQAADIKRVLSLIDKTLFLWLGLLLLIAVLIEVA